MDAERTNAAGAPQPDPIVEIWNLKFAPPPKRQKRGCDELPPGLDLPHLSISPGRVHALVGGSGCGKSLLLSLLATFPPATWRERSAARAGKFSFRWFGETFEAKDFRDARAYAAKMRDAVERSRGNIWYLPQNLPADRVGAVSVRDALEEIVRATAPGKSREEIEKAADDFFEKLNAGGETFFDWDAHRDTPVGKLSGGERKRFEICARVVALNLFDENGKALLLLDEPTAGLDCVRAKRFFKFIKELSGQDGDVAFVVATHDLQFLDEYADAIVSVRRDDVDDESTPDVEEDRTCCEIFCGSVADYKKTFGGAGSVLEVFERNNRRGENGSPEKSAGVLQRQWKDAMPELFS